MQIQFHAVAEDRPGEKFRQIFTRAWPAYKKWWLSEGVESRPTYLACRRAFKTHMPELVPIYDGICETVGGGDLESRFLSLFCPPAYLSGCSQAVWPGDEPLLVRNYDYSPHGFDALVIKSNWTGKRRVLGMSDCLIGLLDGINDAGLAVSLTFGGKRTAGQGFGVPVILRYVLETCDNAVDAAEVTARIPTHMAYNITVLDKNGVHRTIMTGPGQQGVITDAAVATNHQAGVEWTVHAKATASVERERFLLQRMTHRPETADRFVSAFLRPPLYSTAFSRGFGTLYTAELWPNTQEIVLRWPSGAWGLSLENFEEGAQTISYVADTHASRVETN